MRPAFRRRRLDRRLLVAGALVVAAVAAGVAVLASREGGRGSLVPVAPNSVAVINPTTNHIVDAVPVGASPRAIAGSQSEVSVVNDADRTLSVIETATRKVRTFATGSNSPTDVTFGLGAIWVANGRDGTITSVQGTFINSIHVGRSRPRSPVGSSVLSVSPIVAYDEAVWALVDVNPTGIVRVDPAGRVVSRVPGFSGATDLAAGFGSLWVADNAAGTVDRIDPRTRTVVATIAIAGGPFVLAVGEGAVWAVALSSGHATVWRVDPATNAPTDSIRTGGDSTGIAVGAGAVWVTHSKAGTVSRIDPGTRTVTATIDVGNHPGGIAVAGGYLWVPVDEADPFNDVVNAG